MFKYDVYDALYMCGMIRHSRSMSRFWVVEREMMGFKCTLRRGLGNVLCAGVVEVSGAN